MIVAGAPQILQLAPPALKVTPHVAFTWEGVPFEDLGLMEFLKGATFTQTVKRHKGKKKGVAGKPKVGGATLVFSLENREFAKFLFRLLTVNHRPVIGVAMGHTDQDVYWVGSFKLDKNTWAYQGASVNSVTLTGLANKVAAMGENSRPRKWESKRVRAIMQDLADEYGFALDLDLSDQALDAKVSYVKTNDDDDWNFLLRVAEDAGAASTYWLRDRDSADAPDLATQARTLRNARSAQSVLRVSKFPGFLDATKFKTDKLRPYKLGYGANMAEPSDADVLVQAINITQDHYRKGAAVVSAKKKGVGTAMEFALFSPAPVVAGAAALAAPAYNRTRLSAPTRLPGKGKVAAAKAAKAFHRSTVEDDAGDVYRLYTSSPPWETAASLPQSSKLLAIALAGGFHVSATVKLSPGLPFLLPPNHVELLGTDGFDGLYGIEEATLHWGGGSGLTMDLSCKALGPLRPKSASPSAADGPTSIEVALIHLGGTRSRLSAPLKLPSPPKATGSSRGATQAKPVPE